MEREYNYQAFTPKEVKQGLHTDLIQMLLKYNEKSDEHFMDIHITTDGYCLMVEWDCVPYNRQWGGVFVYKTLEELEEERLNKLDEDDEVELDE